MRNKIEPPKDPLEVSNWSIARSREIKKSSKIHSISLFKVFGSR